MDQPEGGGKVTHEDMVGKVVHLLEFEAASHEQHKTIFSRLDKQDAIIESLRTMCAGMSALAEGQERIAQNLRTVREDVDELKAKPGRRWETVITHILTAAVGALAAYALARLGIS